jgi:uncharacterized RmlC-like cupin family protein
METTGARAVTVLRPAGAEESKQGLLNHRGISAETCGARAIWLGIITVPPGARSRAHLHEDHETAMYVLQGAGEMWYGDQLQHHITCTAGDFCYIPAGVPHVVANPSQTEPAVAIAARTDPNEQESVILLPELDAPGDARA